MSRTAAILAAARADNATAIAASALLRSKRTTKALRGASATIACGALTEPCRVSSGQRRALSATAYRLSKIVDAQVSSKRPDHPARMPVLAKRLAKGRRGRTGTFDVGTFVATYGEAGWPLVEAILTGVAPSKLSAAEVERATQSALAPIYGPGLEITAGWRKATAAMVNPASSRAGGRPRKVRTTVADRCGLCGWAHSIAKGPRCQSLRLA